MTAKEGLTKELTALEKKYWSALKSKNASQATALSDNPSIVVGAQGVGEVDREQLSGMIANAEYELEDFTLEDIKVRPITDDVAMVVYKVKEKLMVDGEPVSLEAFDSSVWIRRDGKWTCGLHTESIAGDPFGRD